MLKNEIESSRAINKQNKKIISTKDTEIEELKMQMEEYRVSAKNLYTEVKQLKNSNQVLERKLKAE